MTRLERASKPEGRAPAWPGTASAVLAVAAFGVLLGVWRAGGGEVDLPWAPTLGLRLHFALDGLGALYALLATGVGAGVFAYSASYLRRHLEHEGGHGESTAAFYGFLLLFMVAMVGLATAQDLIVLFVFFDLTAVCSYFLIGFHRNRDDARWAALMALCVTGISAVLLLVAALLLRSQYGSFSVPDLARRVSPGPVATISAVLIALAALAKSAQVPFQFWLRRAMVAPTPISAYLHSAAMVAAGVLVLGRLHPLLATSETVLTGLAVVGLVTTLIGGVLAFSERELKPLLAYSTVSQYGYVTAMYGLGGVKGVTAAALYVLMHGVAKSALFLTAGTVTEVTGETRLDRLGGLARRLPVLAAASGVAVAAISALPLTLGFFADELVFKAALAEGTWAALLAVLAATLTFAYIWRFWLTVFVLGPPEAEAGRAPWPLVGPVVVAALALIVGGLVVAPFAGLAEAAGAASIGSPAPSEPAYHLDLRPENLMALASFGLGSALVVGWRLVAPLAAGVAQLGARFGPERAYGVALFQLNRLSDAVHRVEVRDLRTRVVAVLLPGSLLVLLGVVGSPRSDAYSVGSVGLDDAPLLATLAIVVLATLGTTASRDHLRLVLALSAVGFGLAAAYALFGAPDVALVAVLIEITLSLLLLGTLGLLPQRILRREAELRLPRGRRLRDGVVAVLAGISATAVVWGALSRPSPASSVASEHVRLAPDAHAKDVVTAILADFRALDTLGEITVVAVALTAIIALLRAERPW